MVHIRDSVATKLLTAVFSVYFLVTLTVTAIHMIAEYNHEKSGVFQDLKVFQRTFERTLAKALWTLDQGQLQSTLGGIAEFPIVIGVNVTDERGQQVGAAGTIVNPSGQTLHFDREGHMLPSDTNALFTGEGLFAYSFPITYEYKGQKMKIGTCTLYSSPSVVLQKVQYGFIFIVINSLIKTFALWIIFLFFARIMLNRPLTTLTEAAKQVNLDNLESLHIEIKRAGNDELKILEKAFNAMIYKLLGARQQLQEINQNLENQVQTRTQELASSLRELEQQNTTLMASNRKLEDLNSTRDQLVKKISSLHDTHVQSLQNSLESLTLQVSSGSAEVLRQVTRDVHSIAEALRPITSLYVSERKIQSKRVLLGETNKKQQILAKMALGGTGVELDIVDNLENGLTAFQTQHYDILCVNQDLIQLAVTAHQEHPEIQTVFMTSENVPQYLPVLDQNPFLSNIVARNDEDRTFTLKNILVTVSKLMSHDLFGMEKYLSWGVDVAQHSITSSETRRGLLEIMETEFKALGIRSTLLSKCTMVAEELLMNAIYDAPTDAQGRSLYNHLPRTIPVHLPSDQQGLFRYACDGILLAISVEDPFGEFKRETILEYLKSCYSGQAGSLNRQKGGAGRGLFQIMETCDLLIINVKPRIKTEVIAMFNLDQQKSKTDKTTSLHYFYG